MRRACWYSLLLMILVPGTSSALQLRWSSGSTGLDFTGATRCTLVVEADTAEAHLPSEWRLLWVADSSSLQFVAMDSLDACLLDEAQVSRLDGPASSADSAANQLTAQFCSDEIEFATLAYQVVDLPAGGYGKLKVVALDANHSPQVIESNEVAYNGGIEVDFPSVTLGASTSHAGSQYEVHAAGTGLTGVVSAMVQASDSLWSVPLQITAQSDTTLSAVAEVYASMPASVLRLTSGSGAVTVAPLAADGLREDVDLDFVALADSCESNHCWYFDPDPNVYPKDFAFFYAIGSNPVRGLFHLYYTREYRGVAAEVGTRSFGHAWSSDLLHWEADTTAEVFSVSGNEWDRAHVWAPSVVQVGATYHMFYTGVDAEDDPPSVQNGNQRIGYAVTQIINPGHQTLWTRQSEPTYTVNWAEWARKDSVGPSTLRQELRDPFVMADPDNAGRYLLFMVAAKSDSDLVVGVARNSPGSMDAWQDLGYYRATEREYSGNGLTVESVTAIPDSAYPVTKTSAQATWRLLFTHGIDSVPDSAMYFSAKRLGVALADTTLGSEEDRSWSTPATNLFAYLAGDSTAWGTYATEHLRVGGVDFLATYNGDGIRISRMLWDGTDFSLLRPSVTAVAGDRPATASSVALRLIEATPGAGRLGFEIETPLPQHLRLGIYDIAGRRVRSLLDDPVPAGALRVRWDGKDTAGNPARTGMYFVRLTSDSGIRVVRAALIR